MYFRTPGGDEAIYIQGLLEVKGGGWSFKRYLGTVMPKWNEQKNATFSRKKWNGVPVLAAKNSTLLPKVELLFILKKVPVLGC